MEETLIDTPAENSEDTVVETEAIENEADEVDDSQEGEESEESDDLAEDQSPEETTDELILWDDESATESAPELANETVRTALTGEALKQYDSQLVGFKKYREQAEALSNAVNDFFDPSKAHVANMRLADQQKGIRLVDVTSPESFALSLKEVISELGEVSSDYMLVDPDSLAYVDPEVAKLKRQMLELEKRTLSADALRSASEWKQTKGTQIATLVEKQLGVKVDTDLLYRVHQQGFKPKTVSEVMDAIGRTDFDAWKRLQAKNQTATKNPVPKAATVKTARSAPSSVSLNDAVTNKRAWLQAVQGRQT